jgi:hypothetical protein
MWLNRVVKLPIFFAFLKGCRKSCRTWPMLTFIFCFGSKPSNWFNNSNIVLCTSLSPPEPDSNLVEPIESISSMKIIDGACSLQNKQKVRPVVPPSRKTIFLGAEGDLPCNMDGETKH